jgi:hypothetical protein
LSHHALSGLGRKRDHLTENMVIVVEVQEVSDVRIWVTNKSSEADLSISNDEHSAAARYYATIRLSRFIIPGYSGNSSYS